MTATSDPAGQILGTIFEDRPDLAALLFGREPRWRYFKHGQHLYAWTTERADGDKFWAMEYAPTGPGARTGKATEWKMTRRVGFRQRKVAKARALAWYEKAKTAAGKDD